MKNSHYNTPQYCHSGNQPTRPMTMTLQTQIILKLQKRIIQDITLNCLPRIVHAAGIWEVFFIRNTILFYEYLVICFAFHQLKNSLPFCNLSSLFIASIKTSLYKLIRGYKFLVFLVEMSENEIYPFCRNLKREPDCFPQWLQHF